MSNPKSSMEALALGLKDINPHFQTVIGASHFLPAYAKQELCDSFAFVVDTLTDVWRHESLYAGKVPLQAKSPTKPKDDAPPR